MEPHSQFEIEGRMKTRVHLRGAVVAGTMLLAFGGAAGVVGSPGVAGAAGDAVAGGALGVEASGLLSIADTPTVTLPANGAPQSVSVASIPANVLVSTQAVNASTSATNATQANEQVQSAASVDGLSVLGLTAALNVGTVTSSCTANAMGSTGSATVATLTVAGAPVSVPASLAPNTTITLPAPLNTAVTVVANQQVHSDVAGSSSMTVNGLAITLAGQTITVGQSQCAVTGPDIGNPPTATDLTPASGATNGGTPITISGTGFVSPATVSVGGTPATAVDVVSPTEITANTPAGSAGSDAVTVTTPAGTATDPQPFDYLTTPVAGQPAPVVTGSSPTSGSPSGGGTVTVEGTNLCQVSSVFFGPTAAPSFSANSTCTVLTVTTPPGTGTVPVVITALGGRATSQESYTYTSPGYWIVASDGGVFSFGGAQFYGSTGNIHLNKPIVAMTETPDNKGYWLFASDGGVFAFGDANFYGSVPGVLDPVGRHLNEPIVAAEATPDGMGYRMFAADGGVFDFGDAQFVGSLPGIGVTPSKPVTAATSSPFGEGYWLVAGDGGVFTFGSATFEGSEGGQQLSSPVTTMSSTPDGLGYTLFGSNGSVYTFGDAHPYGSMSGKALNAPIAAGATTSTGAGYWMFAADGGVFNFGDAPFLGSLGSLHLNQPIVGGVGF